MKKEIYSTLLNVRRNSIFWLLSVFLLTFSFHSFAWSQFIDIANNSPEQINIAYNGTAGNAWGPCGKNYMAEPNMCVVSAHSFAILKLTQSWSISNGAISVITPIGTVIYSYHGKAHRQSLNYIEYLMSTGSAHDYMETHTDGPCTTTRYNCIIYNYNK